MSEPGYPPYTFADLSGKRWSLQITLAKRNRLKIECGFDPAKVVDDEMQSLAAMSSDPERLVQVVWTLIEDQAVAAGITPEAFAANLDGDTIGAAHDALIAAVVNFSHPRLRNALASVFAKNSEIVTQAGDLVAENIDVNAEAKRLIESLTSVQAS